MKKLTDILTEYRHLHKAIPSFNIDCFEIYQAVELAVKELGFPCLVQLSAGEDQFIQAERLLLLVKKARIDGLPIYLNMDHGQDINRLKQLIKLGFDMVHFDGSKLDLLTNQMLSRDLVEFAHFHHSLVEVEFDKIMPTGNLSNHLTDPLEAQKFVAASNADLFAVSIGNQHGASSIAETLDLNLLNQINSLIPYTFLTLHGGSGVDPGNLKSAINSGIVKININTDLRHAYRGSLTQTLANDNSDKIYQILNPVIIKLSQIIKSKILSFANQDHV